jgi:hypothetical protein
MFLLLEQHDCSSYEVTRVSGDWVVAFSDLLSRFDAAPLTNTPSEKDQPRMVKLLSLLSNRAQAVVKSQVSIEFMLL